MAKSKMQVFQLTDGTWIAGDAFIEAEGATRSAAVAKYKARIKELKNDRAQYVEIIASHTDEPYRRRNSQAGSLGIQPLGD